MKITAATTTAINKALSDKGMSMTSLGDKIGKSRSWVSKLLGGKNEIPRLSSELIDQINDVLGIELNPIQFAEGSISPTMLALSKAAESDPALAHLLETLLTMHLKSEGVGFPASSSDHQEPPKKSPGRIQTRETPSVAKRA